MLETHVLSLYGCSSTSCVGVLAASLCLHNLIVLLPCLHILVVLPPRCPLRFLVLRLFFCQFLAQCLRLVRLFLARVLRWFFRWFVPFALLFTQTIQTILTTTVLNRTCPHVLLTYYFCQPLSWLYDVLNTKRERERNALRADILVLYMQRAMQYSINRPAGLITRL